jgi:two-component system sensor histidine kinase DesK
MAARSGRAPFPVVRRVVLAVLLTNVVWVVALPLRLTRPPSTGGWVVLVLLAAASGAALALVLRAAVTPATSPATCRRLVAAQTVVALALWPVTFAWAGPGHEPWAWVAASVIGAAPLVLRWPAACLLAAGLLVAVAVGAAVWGQSVTRNLVLTLVAAAALMLMGQVVVWLLRLLVAADAARTTEAELAVSQERLRLAQELHDLLGQRLGVIALKAELAGQLVGNEPARCRAETADIQRLAGDTLRDVRTAVHELGTVDLAAQLQTARLVLSSAGVRPVITVEPLALPPAASQLVAAVIREAVTNVLRHSDARTVWIDLATTDGSVTLAVLNDEPRSAPGLTGLGLAGLAQRCAQAGAVLRYGRAGDNFEVRVELPVT